MAKADIDALKVRLDRKEQERKVRLREDQLRQEDTFEEAAEEIIDEEELVMLKQMKDLKKSYRDSFNRLKAFKSEFSDAQTQIDLIKQRLISEFEGWYAIEFEQPEAAQTQAYNANLQDELANQKTSDSLFGVAGDQEDEAQTFMRAKKKVETLHRARKMEKTVRR